GNPWDSVTLKLWFGGLFTRDETGLVYSSRVFRTVGVEVDEFCWFMLLEEAEKCGSFSRNIDVIFFMDPIMGLQRIVDDVGAQVMSKFAVKNRVVECFLISGGEVAHLMHLIEEEGNGNDTTIVKCSKKLIPRRKNKSSSIITARGGPPPKEKNEYAEKRTPLQKNKEISTLTSINEPKSKQLTKTLNESSPKVPEISSIIETTSTIQPHFDQSYDFNDVTLSNLFASYEEEADLACLNINADLEGEDISEEDDPGYDPDLEEGGETDSEVDLVEELSEDTSEVDIVEEGIIDGEDNIVEPQWESDGYSEDEEALAAKKTVKEWNSKAIAIAKQVVAEAASLLLPDQTTQQTTEFSVEDGAASDYDHSGDEVETPGESEDESVPGKRKKSAVSVIDERSDFSKLKWCVGIRFPTRENFRECVTRYAVAQGRNLVFVVSDNSRGRRLGVKCKEGCPFKLYGSWDNQSACFLVKSVNPSHNCQRTMESNRQLKSSWVAKQFLEVFKNKPHWPASEIIDTVRRAYKVDQGRRGEEIHMRIQRKKGKLTKHGLEMSCSVCKSKEHNKRKCPDKGKVPPPPPKRGRGRPRAVPVGGTRQAEGSQVHHGATALPTRLGRGGRVIRTGTRGARGGRRGGARGGQRAPQGMGVLVDGQGNAFTHLPGSHNGPRSITAAMHNEGVSQNGGKNPVFQEKFVFTLIEGLREINIVVWNSNTLTFDDFIGSGRAQLQDVLSRGYDDRPWPIQTKTGRVELTNEHYIKALVVACEEVYLGPKYAGEVKLIMHYANAQKKSDHTSCATAPPYPTTFQPHLPMYTSPPSAYQPPPTCHHPQPTPYPGTSPYSYPPEPTAYSPYPYHPPNHPSAYPPSAYPQSPSAYPSSPYAPPSHASTYPPMPYPPPSHPSPYPPAG
ncbi:hypothetical protein KSS87_011441, partial [Heliosperma pusillum]